MSVVWLLLFIIIIIVIIHTCVQADPTTLDKAALAQAGLQRQKYARFSRYQR